MNDLTEREGFIHNGQIVYRVTGEGIAVSLDSQGNDLRGARHEDPARRIVTTQVGDRIRAAGEWRTVARVAVHAGVPLEVQHARLPDLL